jgi:hypothetical protein
MKALPRCLMSMLAAPSSLPVTSILVETFAPAPTTCVPWIKGVVSSPVLSRAKKVPVARKVPPASIVTLPPSLPLVSMVKTSILPPARGAMRFCEVGQKRCDR